jgi:hypothetical protein
MSASYPAPHGPLGGAHPVVLRRRVRELLLIGATAVIPLALALGISVAVPNPSFVLVFGLMIGALGIVALMLNTRLEVSLVIVALYLGLLEGPVKLGSGGHELASVVRDVLIMAVVAGAILRLSAKRQRVELPPLTAWVMAFVLLVLIEAFNPQTQGITKILGGFRQQLEWVPFFFFGYVLMRSKQRFRKLFLVLGVIALANGVVSTYQTGLSPPQLASWGPGYKELVYGTTVSGTTGGLGARTYSSEGVAHVRPPGLGTDSGFSGGVGVLALPCALALLATSRRRKWVPIVLALGALAAVTTGLGRLQVVGAVLAVLSFALLSLSAGRRVTRPLGALLAVIALAIPLGAVFVTQIGSGTFSRYAEIAPENVTSSKDKKTSSLTHIPKQLEAAPFGVGLGTVGAAAGFGGQIADLLEGHGVSSETQYNFVSDELGLPGLILWVALSIQLIVLVLRRLRTIVDVELRIDLAAVFAAFIALTIMGLSGPTMASAAFGPFFWGAAGIAAYWFLGPGRALQSRAEARA